jgi:hypothetical protein
MIGIGLSLTTIASMQGGGGSEPSEWILASGVWNDNGIWDDAAIWKDAA